ncbi:MAG: hypothetical protein LBI68_01125 [Azoarcus sp.]|jgi:hypothetical protein|nr:hypothetical protein [Azoarcus sp.]
MNAAENEALGAALPSGGSPLAPLARTDIRAGEKDHMNIAHFPAIPREETFARASAWAERAQRALAPALLLLVWDVSRLSATVAWRRGRTWQFSEEASSRLADFAPALDEALDRLKAIGIRPPRSCYLAARFIVPARVDLPIDPEKPRPFLQMRELARAEMEPAVSEAGALWTIGAVLAARGLIAQEDRERIALELALRREQSNAPMYFGQVACDLGLIGKEDLQAALHLQEKLQTLESTLACGWAGYRGEPGEPPVWLASASGLALWSRFETACKRRGLKLLGGLPLAWSVSEAAGDALNRSALRVEPEGWTDERKHSRIALEIHAEDVVAVLRHRGRVVSARTEGRMERELAVDWLLRLVADWRAGGVNALEIVCLESRDEAAVRALFDDFSRQWGQSPQLRAADATRRGLLEYLAGQYKARAEPLPIIRFGELPRPLWTRPGFWHILLPLLVLAAVIGLGVRQRAEIRLVQTRMDLAELAAKRAANMKSAEAGVILEAQQSKKELDDLRKQLASLLPDVERLRSIENMMAHLPHLLRALAMNISDDMVLDVVRNSSSGGSIGDVMVIGWTNSYSSAQAFALRVQGGLAGFGYSVAQTDVRAGSGRDGKAGYFVSFWLVPRAPVEELGMGEDAPAEDGKTETTVPETTAPEAAVPETAAPETIVPETIVPETEAGNGKDLP